MILRSSMGALIITLAALFVLNVQKAHAEEGLSYEQSIFIAKPAQEVWNALTQKEIVDQYYVLPMWAGELRKGREFFYGTEDSKAIRGRVIEMKEPYVFVHSFRFVYNQGDAETLVAYEIQDLGEMSHLRLKHTGFVDKNQTYNDITGGWPVILSGLKTLLETGKPLPWPKQN